MLTSRRLPPVAARAAVLALLTMVACTPARRAPIGPAPEYVAPVRVITDRWGIPHVRAQNLTDLYRAWGWVAARDRLWQLALTRAQGRGESHRWLGNDALRSDGGAQLFRLAERADSIWARDRHDAALAAALLSYSAGINDYLRECESGRRPWPAELARLDWKPEPWRPEDCVLLLLGFGVTLDLDAPELRELDELTRFGPERVRERHAYEGAWTYDTVPDSAARRLWPDGLPRLADSEAVAPSAVAARPLESARDLLAALRPGAGDPDQRASNEFAVGGRRTASGAPLLANDPHLGFSTPGPLHVVHVSVPGVVEAIGADVPGLPLIAIGRNERAAWGLTALSVDVCDVYADTLSDDGKRARGPAGWTDVVTKPFALSLRVLGVPVPALGQVRRYTAHGPVVQWDPKHHVAYAMRWSALEDARITLRGLVGLERSRSAAELQQRLRTLVTPTFSAVMADVDGDVRWQGAGLVPRRPFPFARGPLPSDGRHEWAGFIPVDSMPAWRVPPEAFVVNANNRPVGAAYPYPWTRFDWAHDRAWRLAELLGPERALTMAGAAAIQNDVHSRAGDRWVPALLAAFAAPADSLAPAGDSAAANVDSLAPRTRAAIDSLRAWDGEVRRDRVAPTLFRSWLGALLRGTKTDGLPGLAFALLQGRAPVALADSSLGAPPAMAGAALQTALDTLSAKLGPEVGTWTWARVNRARFKHALAAAFPAEAARWEPPMVPADGDRSSPAVSGARLPWTFEVGHGPVLRMVTDLAVRDSSLGVIAPANGGAPPNGVPEMAARWADHRYVPFYLDWVRIEAAKADEVTLGR